MVVCINITMLACSFIYFTCFVCALVCKCVRASVSKYMCGLCEGVRRDSGLFFETGVLEEERGRKGWYLYGEQSINIIFTCKTMQTLHKRRLSYQN